MSFEAIAERLATEHDSRAINAREEFSRDCWDCNKSGYLVSYQTPAQAKQTPPNPSREYCTLYCAKCGSERKIQRPIIR